MRASRLLVLALLTSCGGGDANNPGEGTCTLGISASPSQPTVGDEVYLTVTETLDGDVFGERSFDWAVSFDGGPVTVSAVADPEDAVFDAAAAGVFEVTVTGSIGATTCNGGELSLNALEPGAELVDFTLRVVAAGNRDDRIQISAPLGVDYDLGAISVPGAGMTSGTIAGPDGGIPAYIEIVDGGSRSLYAFSGDDGAFALPLSSGRYDLLISPEDEGLAPTRIEDLTLSDIGGEHTVGAGQLIEGVVRGAGGSPVPGASISLRVDGAPPAIATAAGDGTFTLRVAAAGQASIEVTPGWSSPLPAAAATSVPVAPTTSLEIDFPDLTTRSFAATVTADGSPVPGARVRFQASLPGLADIKSGAYAGQATLTHHSTRIADAGGGITADLPAGSYVAYLEAEGRVAGAVPVDLSGGDGPSELVWPQPATLSGLVVDPSGEPIEGAVVRATPGAALAGLSGARDQMVTGPSGAFSLTVVAGVAYRLDVGGVPDRERRSMSLSSGAAGSETAGLEVELAPGTELTGEIQRVGAGPVAAAHVSLFEPTADPKIDPPLAVGVTDALGAFSLQLAGEAE